MTEATEATAAAVFATHTQLRFDMMDSDETKLSPHKQKFVEACRYVADNWNSCVEGHSTKSGMTKTEARKSFLLAGIGVKAEPKRKGSEKSDFLSDMRNIGAEYDIAIAIVKERDISSVQYLRKLVTAAKPAAANAETETPAETPAETDAVITPTARLAKDAAAWFDYGLKNGYDFQTMLAMLDVAASNAGYIPPKSETDKKESETARRVTRNIMQRAG